MKMDEDVRKKIEHIQLAVDNIQTMLENDRLISDKDITLVISSSIIGVISAIVVNFILSLGYELFLTLILLFGIVIGLCGLSILMILVIRLIMKVLVFH